MGYKMQHVYYYTEFKGYPEATEISRRRERPLSYVERILFSASLVVLFYAITCFKESVIKALLIIAAVVVVWILYFSLFRKMYDNHTNQLISEAIIQQDKETAAKQMPQKQSKAIEQSSTKGVDLSWIDDGNGFTVCPQCGKRMTHDFARYRGKCPDCGKKYTVNTVVNSNGETKQVQASDIVMPGTETQSEDDDYISYIISQNPDVTREDALAFISVLDIYEKTDDKIKTLEAFDAFVCKMAAANKTHAGKVNGFFCLLFGKYIFLSDAEIKSLTDKYAQLIASNM